MKIIRKTELDKGFLIDLEDGNELRVSEELYFTRYLYEREELSKYEIEELLFEDGVLEAEILCKKKLATGLKSSGRLFTYLKDKGIDEIVSRKAMGNLKKEKYIDDMKFASKKIKRKMISSPVSQKALALWLESKGLDKETARKAVEEAKLDDKKTAKEIIDKKFRNKGNKVKIIKYLASRGFDEDIISKVTETEDLWNMWQ